MPDIVITGLPAILIAFAAAMFVTWYYIPRVVQIVEMRHLEDTPGRHKIHKNNVPTLGGIGIFAGFLVGYLLGIDGYLSGLSYLTAAAIILFFVGIKDDLVNVNYQTKLLGEIAAALIVAVFTDLHFTSLHGFLGFQGVPAPVSLLLTVFIIVLIINSVNLIDGIDGLAASVGIVASTVFGVFFFLSGDYGYTVIAAALTGSLLAFLRFNISDGRYKIFMGDTGSLVIGFVLAVFAVHFNELVAAGESVVALHSAPAVTIGILIVPLFDTLRVIVVRLSLHQNPFVADRRHLHHLMLRTGLSHRSATLLMVLFNLLAVAVAFLLDGIGIVLLALLLLALCLTATRIVSGIVRRREAGVAAAAPAAAPAAGVTSAAPAAGSSPAPSATTTGTTTPASASTTPAGKP